MNNTLINFSNILDRKMSSCVVWNDVHENVHSLLWNSFTRGRSQPGFVHFNIFLAEWIHYDSNRHLCTISTNTCVVSTYTHAFSLCFLRFKIALPHFIAHFQNRFVQFHNTLVQFNTTLVQFHNTLVWYKLKFFFPTSPQVISSSFCSLWLSIVVQDRLLYKWVGPLTDVYSYCVL